MEYNRKAWRDARNAVLLNENPRFEIDPSQRLDRIMEDVHDFINASYKMDSNPLTYLRRYFPHFTWSFFCGEKGERFYVSIAEQVRCSDYIWHTWDSLEDSGGIVLARQTGRPNPRMLFYSSEPHETPMWRNKLKDILPDVRFVLKEVLQLKILE